MTVVQDRAVWGLHGDSLELIFSRQPSCFAVLLAANICKS